MTIGTRSWFWIALAWLAACAPQKDPATEVVVEVQSDLDALAAVDVEVRDADDKNAQSVHHFKLGPSLELPFSFAVAPASGTAAVFVVVASGRDAGGALLGEAKAKASFEPGKVVGPLVLFLSAACAVACDAGKACDPSADAGSGACVAIPTPKLGSFKLPKATTRADAGDTLGDAGPKADPGSSQMDAGGARADGGAARDGAVQKDGSVQRDGGLKEDGAISPHDAAPSDSGDGATNPTPIEIGSACTPSDQCKDGAPCVDGICCKTACTAACSACNVQGSEGTCTPLPSGQTPLAGHGSCGPDPQSSCQRDGTCDGNGGCAKWPLQTQCKAASCNLASNEFAAESSCDGAGTCVSPNAITCAPFLCMPDQTSCYGSCTSGGSECSGGNVCNNNSCGLKVQGSSCSVDGECQSTHCADSVCCDGGCSGLCQACDLSTSRGICTTINPGQPHATHGACNGVGAVCGGQCAGSPTACTYPGSGTPCRTQSCSGGVLTLAAGCNSGGACPTTMTQNCSPPTNASATCNSTACSFSCDQGFVQSGNSCIACGHANQPCCTGPFAACVPGTACGGTSKTCDVNDLYVLGWSFDQSFNVTSVAIHWNGSAWGSVESVFPAVNVHVSSAWGFAPGSYYAVGDSGSLAERSISSWIVCSSSSACMGSGTTTPLGAIYGFGATDIWIASNTAMLHWNGANWVSTASGLPSSHAASGFWGSSSNDLWFSGGYHYTGSGSGWAQSSAISGSRAYWGSASNDVWAVGDAINRWSGSIWSPAYGVAGSPPAHTLLAISGSAGDDVWAVGYDGTGSIVIHWDGSSWTDHTGSVSNPSSIWVASKKQAWLTANGAVYTLNGSTWSQVTLPALPAGTQAISWEVVYGSANGR